MAGKRKTTVKRTGKKSGPSDLQRQQHNLVFSDSDKSSERVYLSRDEKIQAEKNKSAHEKLDSKVQLSPTQLYLNDLGVIDLLSPKEELRLAKLVQKGNQKARDDMIKANLRLVVKIAKS